MLISEEEDEFLRNLSDLIEFHDPFDNFRLDKCSIVFPKLKFLFDKFQEVLDRYRELDDTFEASKKKVNERLIKKVETSITCDGNVDSDLLYDLSKEYPELKTFFDHYGIALRSGLILKYECRLF